MIFNPKAITFETTNFGGQYFKRYVGGLLTAIYVMGALLVQGNPTMYM